MIPFLKDNYIRPSGEGNSFKVDIDKIKQPFGNLYEESVLAAEEIYSLKEGKLHVMYSGGLDSEYVLSVFHHLGMEIKPVIVRLMPDYNDFDTKYAFDFCKQHRINPVVVDIDFKWFVESGEHLETAVNMKSSMYHYCATAYAMGKIDGSILLGEGQIQVDFNKQTRRWMFEIDERDYVFVNYMKMYGIDGTPFFNRWRPGMLASSMLDPYIKALGNNQIPEHTTSDDGKVEMYNRHSPFKLEPRPKYSRVS